MEFDLNSGFWTEILTCMMMERYSRNVTSKLLGTVGLGSWDIRTWGAGSPLDETTETTDV